VYCELKDKEVEITKVLEAKGGNNKITFYGCSGDYFELAGQKIKRLCDMRHDSKCLLRNYGK